MREESKKSNEIHISLQDNGILLQDKIIYTLPQGVIGSDNSPVNSDIIEMESKEFAFILEGQVQDYSIVVAKYNVTALLYLPGIKRPKNTTLEAYWQIMLLGLMELEEKYISFAYGNSCDWKKREMSKKIMFARRNGRYVRRIDDILCVPRFTEDALGTIAKDAYYKHRRDTSANLPMTSYLSDEYYYHGIKHGDKVRVIAVDDEYTAWLEENGLEHDSRTLMLYMQSMPAEDAGRLLKKHRMNMDVRVMTLPVAFWHTANDVTSYSLKDKDRKVMEELLEPSYPGWKVFVPGYMLTLKMLHDYENRLQDIGLAYFHDGQRVKLGALDDQDYRDETGEIKVVHIPFYIARETGGAELSLEELMPGWERTEVVSPVEIVNNHDKAYEGQDKNIGIGSLNNTILHAIGQTTVGFASAYSVQNLWKHMNTHRAELKAAAQAITIMRQQEYGNERGTVGGGA